MPNSDEMRIQAFFKREGTKVLGKKMDTAIVTYTYIETEQPFEEALSVTTLNSSAITDEDTQEYLKELENSVISQLHSGNSSTTQQDVDEVLQKQLTSTLYDGRTEVSLNLKSNKRLQGTSVLLEIPKCAAELVQDIQFQNNNFEILKDDPLIAWHFTELDQDIDLKYEFKKELDPECLQQLKVLSLVDEIGDNVRNDFLSSPLFAILLVPVVAGILVYFSKFAQSSTKIDTKTGDVSSELVNAIKARLDNGQDYETIIADMVQQGFDKSELHKAFEDATKVNR
jgi:hypothetical protein